MDAHHEIHGLLRLDPEARNLKHTRIEEFPEKGIWRITQTLIDQEDLNDHTATFELDLTKSDELHVPALRLVSITDLTNSDCE